MPALISRTQKTDPFYGIINIKDIHKMLNDFRKKVIIDCADPARTPVQKRYHFDISLERLTKIANQVQKEDKGEKGKKPKPKYVRVNIVLTLPGQLNCKRTESIEDNLSILVCGVDSGNNSMLKEDQFVLVEGFNDNETANSKVKNLEDDECCVQGYPMLDV